MSTKKISRKDIAKMSFGDFLRAAKEPYRRLFSYLRPYRGRFLLGILFGGLFGAIQGLLIFDIQFVAGAVFPDHEAKATSAVVKWFPQLANLRFSDSGLGTVLTICATIPLLMGIRGLCGYLNSYCMLWCSVRVLDDIRQDVFKRTLAQSMEFYNKAKSGDLVQTVFNQTRMAQQALTTIAGDIVKQPISIVVGLVSMFIVDWKFTLASFLIFPLCLVPVVLVAKKVRKAGTREEEEAGQLMVIMHEAFSGIRVVKTHAREEFEAERFNRANTEIMRHIMRWRKAMELAQPAVETVASLGIAAALLWAWKRGLKFNDFAALNAGMVMLYPAFKALSRIYLMMQKCLASTTKVFELLDRKPAIQDAPDAKPLGAIRGEIRFENVEFGYGRDKTAVHSVDLVIQPNSTVALVGASGAGKTTMLALLQRLYDVEKGRITIDGADLRQITQASLREHIATVNQDVFLFHDTIANNIRYGRLDATQEEIEAAAKQAFAHEFILSQPNGYETVIGDKGSLLSGGQQQRLSIARALLKNAPILLLDEATSALDSESEKQIKAALEVLAEGRTVVAIAHRLSTILHADQIVVMENGRVLDVGRHSELFDRNPVYRRLYDLQFNQPTLAPTPADALASLS
ncbi:MAG TPA: ABC transporter transmembrane domain-containing protein [Chthoniobacteraceae bacterium]|jgi:subfamily B ATP-binding cassette protein MsbA|nr:ABC transporter transmembrane domain-containing protein [Chthoniobacteraceae bacterium]